ncbi:hypothetical protein Tco_0264425 [Tanacetum coccineum]
MRELANMLSGVAFGNTLRAKILSASGEWGSPSSERETYDEDRGTGKVGILRITYVLGDVVMNCGHVANMYLANLEMLCVDMHYLIESIVANVFGYEALATTEGKEDLSSEKEIWKRHCPLGGDKRSSQWGYSMVVIPQQGVR